jgi:hypothetical protein
MYKERVTVGIYLADTSSGEVIFGTTAFKFACHLGDNDIIIRRYRLAAVRKPPGRSVGAVIFWRRDG